MLRRPGTSTRLARPPFAVLPPPSALRHTADGAWRPGGTRLNMNFTKKLMVQPGTKVKLSDFDPDEKFGYSDGKKTQAKQAKILERLDDLQYLFYAVKDRALLVVLQGMDTSGKDGTIRHVMSGMSPQGCDVTSFKNPSPEELAHDFLWRVHKAVPEKGK